MGYEQSSCAAAAVMCNSSQHTCTNTPRSVAVGMYRQHTTVSQWAKAMHILDTCRHYHSV